MPLQDPCPTYDSAQTVSVILALHLSLSQATHVRGSIKAWHAAARPLPQVTL